MPTPGTPGSAQITGASTLTVTGITTSGSNKALFAGVGSSASLPSLTTSVTYNGVTLTEDWDFVAQVNFHNSGHHIVAPAASGNLVVTLAGTDDELVLIGVPLSDVNQATPIGTVPSNASGASTTASVTVTSASGELVLAMLYALWSGATPGAGETELAEEIIVTGPVTGAVYSEAGAASVTISPTRTAGTTTEWLINGVSFKPAAAGTLVVGWMPAPAQVWPKRLAPFDTRPALALTPATLPPKISGMAWFEPPDRQPRPPPRFEPGPALALTPATLPPKIAGMAWFEPPDVLPRRGPVFDTARIFVAPITAPVVTVPQGWAPVPDVLPRRRVNVLDVLAFVPTPDIAVGRSLGWFVPPDAPWLRKFLAASDPPALGGITIAPVPLGWLVVPETIPSRRAPLSSDPTFVFTATAPAPTPISGMAWFIPPEPLPVRPVIWVTAPSWVPQEFAFVPPAPDTELHFTRFFADVGALMSR